MKNRISKILIGATVVLFGFSSSAFAFWSLSKDKNANTYGIHNGSTQVDMGLTSKQARKLAKKLNQIEKKDSESSE